nr:hypothetical protein [Candidatus Saccharibacteria bacterium]
MFQNKLYTKIINSLAILIFLALPLVNGVSLEAANTLAKSGVASSPANSTTNVDRGGTIDWTVDLTTDGTTELKLQDSITGDQEYVPGSLVLPSVNDSAGGIDYSWDSSFYDDLGCNTSGLESEDTKCLEAMSSGLISGGLNGFGGVIDSPPATTINAGTGGDGYVPVIYDGKIYSFYHYGHTNAISCVDMSTSAICTTGSWPSYFSSDPGSPLGTGTQDIWSGYFNEVVQRDNYAYYIAQRANDVGIGCVDLNTYTNCGYTQLASIPRQVPASVLDAKLFTTLANPVEYQGKIYTYGKDGNFYCADITTMPTSVCSGYPVATTSPAIGDNKFFAQQQLIGDKVYYLAKSKDSNNEIIGCFDLTLASSCVGFSATSSGMSGTAFIRNMITIYDTSMNPTGFCNLFDTFAFHISGNLYTNFIECFDLLGNSVASPGSNFVPGITLGTRTSMISGYEEEIFGTRVYYPLTQS